MKRATLNLVVHWWPAGGKSEANCLLRRNEGDISKKQNVDNEDKKIEEACSVSYVDVRNAEGTIDGDRKRADV